MWSAKFCQNNILIGKKHLIGKLFWSKKDCYIWYTISFIGIQILEQKHLLVPKKIYSEKNPKAEQKHFVWKNFLVQKYVEPKKKVLEKNLIRIFFYQTKILAKKNFDLKKNWSNFCLFSTVKSPNKNLDWTQIQRLTKLNTLDLSVV